MKLKQMNGEQLIASTRNTINVETAATTNVVRHFREIYDRKLHLERGYSSLFLMAVKEFGYDKSCAQRRVSAMMLSLSAPEVLEKIDRREMCLESAANIQTFLNKERGAKRPYSIEETRALVEKCSGLSTRDVQIELASLNPTIDFRESKKYVAHDRIRITHTISVQLDEKIERIKDLLSHVNPYMTREEVISEAGEIQLVARFENRDRTILAEDSHRVWLKNEDEGCEYVDPRTGRRCGTRHSIVRERGRDYVSTKKAGAYWPLASV